MSTSIPRRAWFGVGAMAFSVFAVTATEMMPIGLLPDMAADLHVSDGSVGLSVTLYGIVAGLLAPLWTSWTRLIDRRTLLLVIVGVFVVGNTATGMVTSYAQLMVIRLVIGVLHGLMWSIIAGAAVRLVPAAAARATAMVFTGISAALVLGVPAGTVLGSWLGWRAAFVALAIVAGVAWVAIHAAVPTLPSQTTMCVADVPTLVRRDGLVALSVVTALVVIANYTAYTYISLFVIDEVGVDTSSVGVYLLAYGVAGVVGNVAAGGVVARNHERRRVVLIVGITLMSTALGAVLLPLCKVVAIGAVATWGFAYSALPVVLQTLVFRVAPQATDAATSLYVLVFNVSIAAGAGIGALGVDLSGPRAPIVIGVLLGIVGCGTALRIRLSTSPSSYGRR